MAVWRLVSTGTKESPTIAAEAKTAPWSTSNNQANGTTKDAAPKMLSSVKSSFKLFTAKTLTLMVH